MVFSSLMFVFVFLPITILLYFVANQKYKNFVLLAVSLLFYSWGEPALIVFMLVSIAVNFLMAKIIDQDSNSESFRKVMVALTIAVNLGMLVFFKYTGFLGSIFTAFSGVKLTLPQIIMPIGISFYTFQALSYVIDVYRKEVKANNSLTQVALYVSFFPQLIAGPIVRYKDINDQIADRRESFPLFNEGVRLFIYGLSKKLIIANFAGKVGDEIFKMNYGDLSVPMAWLGIFAFTIQIFFDFSGYSTMAIGLGKMFGFHFLENFNYPYISTSIQEFWRRWHISLSTWFRDYLYIPLGGNRKGKIRTYVNQIIVFLFCGFWHGAGFAFIFWGLYHGVLLTIEKFKFIKKIQSKIPAPVLWIFTMILIMIGWVFFKVEGFKSSLKYLMAMFGGGSGAIRFELNSMDALILFVGILFCIPWHTFIKDKVRTWQLETFRVVSCVILLVIDITLMVSSTYNPFIYFRF